jgi:hypothetical protein
MNELDYLTLIELTTGIKKMLENLEQDLLDYSSKANDDEFGAMIRKAIYYREILKRIDEQLNQK